MGRGPLFCDKNNYKVFSIIGTKFSDAVYVRCSDATFYDLLNVMDQGTSTLPV